MGIELRLLDCSCENDYEDLLACAPSAMFNHSLRFREFLKKVTSPAEDKYLLGYEANELMVALPLFVKQGALGDVINSLPFYGSHGGLVAKPSAGALVKREVLNAYQDLLIGRQVLCSTVVESPFESGNSFYTSVQPDYEDYRIGQISLLPPPSLDREATEQALLNMYHQKTRNIVRKALKIGFSVTHSGSKQVMRKLHEIHDKNIRAIGGIPKSLEVFEAIQDVFRYNEDYRVYFAENDHGIVSLLLVFYFNEKVEYFTPATIEEYRNQQPLSLLIHRAMCDAVEERQSRYWNWGGTWLNQDGVYQFKSRWGTKDYPYRYFISVNRERKDLLLTTSRSELLSAYQYFYTIPFSELKA